MMESPAGASCTGCWRTSALMDGWVVAAAFFATESFWMRWASRSARVSVSSPPAARIIEQGSEGLLHRVRWRGLGARRWRGGWRRRRHEGQRRDGWRHKCVDLFVDVRVDDIWLVFDIGPNGHHLSEIRGTAALWQALCHNCALQGSGPPAASSRLSRTSEREHQRCAELQQSLKAYSVDLRVKKNLSGHTR